MGHISRKRNQKLEQKNLTNFKATQHWNLIIAQALLVNKRFSFNNCEVKQEVMHWHLLSPKYSNKQKTNPTDLLYFSNSFIHIYLFFNKKLFASNRNICNFIPHFDQKIILDHLKFDNRQFLLVAMLLIVLDFHNAPFES